MIVQTPRITAVGTEGLLEFRTPTPGCDFCGVALTDSWVRFDCADFVRRVPGLPLGIHLVGFWAACAPCAPLVRARDWKDLIDHVTAVRLAAGITDAARPDVRAELAGLYLQLERHLTGAESLGGGGG